MGERLASSNASPRGAKSVDALDSSECLPDLLLLLFTIYVYLNSHIHETYLYVLVCVSWVDEHTITERLSDWASENEWMSKYLGVWKDRFLSLTSHRQLSTYSFEVYLVILLFLLLLLSFSTLYLLNPFVLCILVTLVFVVVFIAVVTVRMMLVTLTGIINTPRTVLYSTVVQRMLVKIWIKYVYTYVYSYLNTYGSVYMCLYHA